MVDIAKYHTHILITPEQVSLSRDHLLGVPALDRLSKDSGGGDKELAQAWYTDQILPFDIVLAAANEYGAMAAAKILGVEILNEGSGISIDDAVSESSATFVARGIEPLAAVNSPFQGAIGGESLPTV